MKLYVGRRENITTERWVSVYGWAREDAERFEDQVTEPRVYVTDNDGVEIELAHDCHHSPNGFEWGYHGSGPADLARSILKDHLGFVPSCYQAFKRDVIATFDKDGFTLSHSDIVEWLDKQPQHAFQKWEDDPAANMVENAMTAMGDVR